MYIWQIRNGYISACRATVRKPGVTGWAQVNGRNALSWEEKFKFDVEYVQSCSPRLDAKILFITIQKVVHRHGVNANNYMTMEAFKGDAA